MDYECALSELAGLLRIASQAIKNLVDDLNDGTAPDLIAEVEGIANSLQLLSSSLRFGESGKNSGAYPLTALWGDKPTADL